METMCGKERIRMRKICLGQSIQGASHKRNGKECQDFFKVDVQKEYIILAVADGHGSKSCPYSRTGAISATNVFHDVVKEYLKEYRGQLENLTTFLHREGEVSFSKNIERAWQWKIRAIQENNTKISSNTPKDINGKINWSAVYKMYGCTLLGMLITDEFIFSYQMGDGDIMCVDSNGVRTVIDGDHILGVETHSLSGKNAWEKSVTSIVKNDILEHTPRLYFMSTDGLANSYIDSNEFKKTCQDYYNLFIDHREKDIKCNLNKWLEETSELGCGDDITLLMLYFEG